MLSGRSTAPRADSGALEGDVLRLERHNVSLMRALAREEECRYACKCARRQRRGRAPRDARRSAARCSQGPLSSPDGLGVADVGRHELEQVLWHSDTAEKAGDTPRLHNVLVNSKVQILEDRNRTLKHELERTQMLEEAARRKLAEAMGQHASSPYSFHGVSSGSKRAEADA